MSEENKTILEEEDMDTVVTEEYSENSIQVLEGLEAVVTGYCIRVLP